MAVESFRDQFARIVEMSRDVGDTWDLSLNDQEALKAVIARVRELEAYDPARTEAPTDPAAANVAGWIAMAKHYARIVTAVRVALAEHERCNAYDCGDCVGAIRAAFRAAEKDPET